MTSSAIFRLNALVAENCLIINNRGMNGAAADGCILRNCTMVGNSASGGYNGVCLNSCLENCIVYGNGNDSRQTWQTWFNTNPLVSSYPHREMNVYAGDPCFVDAANGNYHLMEDSPCINAGGNSYVTSALDLDGNDRIVNDTVDIGCYEYIKENVASDLVHRWSFNGDLTDSVGGQTATKVGDVTTGAGQYTLAGGSQGSSYINLGANVLPNDGSAVTLEMWVTQLSAQYYARIWDFGNTGDDDMYMGLFNTGFSRDSIVFRNSGVVVEGDQLAPYTAGTEFYIAVVMTPQNNGSWKLDFYKKDSSGNTLRSYSATTTVGSWTLLGRTQSKCYLGHAIGSADDASASYNEFRIWKKAMTEEELTASAIAGPDADL